MEGEKKKKNIRGDKGRRAGYNPDRIQEYDFFVPQDGGAEEVVAPVDQPAERRNKKIGCNKSMSFFLSD
jgi:hypothetical protein